MSNLKRKGLVLAMEEQSHELINLLDQYPEDEDWNEYIKKIVKVFPEDLIDQLQQLVDGPVWDGDISSKSARDRLIDLGLGIRVCCKGEEGYTGAPYIAYSILKEIKEPR